jgi:hypothetical protein
MFKKQFLVRCMLSRHVRPQVANTRQVMHGEAELHHLHDLEVNSSIVDLRAALMTTFGGSEIQNKFLLSVT